MSPKTISLAIGLTVLGLSLSAPEGLADGPEAPAPAASPQESPTPEQSVILLSNGQILRGQLAEDEKGYVLTQKLGEIRFPKRSVEKVFQSIEEVYNYKLKQIPDRDPDEHMKLAQWCISQDLKIQAKTQLESVLRHSPGHPLAKAMLYNIAAADERAAQRDGQVLQTNVEMPVDPNQPKDLNPDFLRPKRREPAADGPPIIFDLPPAVAAKRFQEFARYVHPELQNRCAGCHNEQSGRAFQLLRAKTARDLNNALLLRTNLDLTLRQVDPESPSKSELLASSVRPHGPNNKPILSGPNHTAYRTLLTWIGRLSTKPEAPTEGVQAAGFSPRSSPRSAEEPAEDDGFAAARTGGAGAAVGQPPAGPKAQAPSQAQSQSPTPNFPDSNFSVPFDPGVPAAPTPSVQKGSLNPTIPSAGPVPSAEKAGVERPGTVGEATAPKSPAAKVKKIDPSALQKFLEKRNAKR